MTQFEGKVAVIAGGGAGIGATTALLLAERGAQVVVADIDANAAVRTAATVVAGGGALMAHQFDISDEASVAELFTRVRIEFGRLDHLVNLAADLSPGTLGPDSASNVTNIPLEAWDRTLEVGLRGFVLTLRYGIPIMVDSGGGSIVNVSSLAAYLGEPVRVAYSVTKTGVNALTRHVASAFGKKNVRCNSVAPGFTMTESAKLSFTDEELVVMARHNPTRRLGKPLDIANAIAFLLSDEAAWVNGQLLAVDGGMTMRQ